MMAGDDGFPAVPLNVSKPNVARMYDHLLDGKDNFEADRRAAQELLSILPDAPAAARENRAFLTRAIRYLTEEAGISQFLDIGSGFPTAENTHEVARRKDPEARVVYADNDPVVTAHARALLATDPACTRVIDGDLRSPDSILGDDAMKILDLARPAGLILGAVMHFIRDDEGPHDIVRALMGALAPGSALVLSHITADFVLAEVSTAAREVYAGATAPAVPRTREQVTSLFGGLELVDPGIVATHAWRPEPGCEGPDRILMYGGVGRLPRR